MPRRRDIRSAATAALGLAAAVVLTGCAPALRGPAARPAEGLLVRTDRTPNARVVFEHPSVARFHATLDPRRLPETARRNAALGMGPRPVPTLDPTPSLDRARRTTLPRNARQLILF